MLPMTKHWIAAVAAVVGFGWGLAAGTAHIFPYDQLVAAKHAVSPTPAEAKPRYSVLREFPEHRRTLFIGDSIIDNAEWADIYPDASIANRGVGGDTSRDILRRLPDALKIRPEVVVISAGLNDPGARITFLETQENYRAMIEMIHEAKAEPIILAPPSPQDDELAAAMVELRAWLSTQAIVVDPNTELGSDGILARYSDDGRHPNGAGYRIIARHLQPFVL